MTDENVDIHVIENLKEDLVHETIFKNIANKLTSEGINLIKDDKIPYAYNITIE